MKPITSNMIEIIGTAKEYPCGSKTFKQFQVQEELEIPCSKPDIEQIVRVYISGEVISSQIIEVSKSTSYEGQKLTGCKLLVEGQLIQKIEYIAGNDMQSIHAAEFTKLFSGYIMLEEDMDPNEPLHVDTYIEDVFVMQIDKRKIFKNVMILLNAVRVHKRPVLDDECICECEDLHTCICKKKKLFSQLVVEETVSLPNEKPDIEQIVKSIVEPEIISLKFINTMKGISLEGQRLTGKKAIAEIRLKQKILYVADAQEQSVHGTENEFYTSAYIVVPETIEGTSPEILIKHKLLKPVITIEDIFLEQLGKRRIFKNISVLIELQLIPTYEICSAHHDNCSSSQMHIMYADGSHDEVITCKSNYKCIRPQWSPAGSQIAFLKGDSSGYMLYVMDIRDLKGRQLTFTKQFDTVTGFTWMEQGRKIAFTAVTDCDKDIYTIDLASLQCKRLTDGNGASKSFKPQPSPDSRYIAYIRSASGLKNIWIMDGSGKNNENITREGFVSDLQWNMNGKDIVYSLSKDCADDRLCSVDIRTREACVLVERNFISKISKLRVSPDGRHVGFIGKGKWGESIYIYDFKSCRLNSIVDCGLNSGISDFVWNIDSTNIYYASDVSGCYNIYSAGLDGCSMKQLTNTRASFIDLSYRPAITIF